MRHMLLIAAALGGCHSSHLHAMPLTEVGVAVPIAPGKTAAWQHALEDLTGPRYAEYEASRKRFGLTSQTTFLQKTPMGDFALIHMTGPDVHAAFHAMSASRDPWDVKWRELTLDLHGVDFGKGERVMPAIAPLYAMESSTQGTQFMFLAPLGPGGAGELRAVAAEVMGPRHAAYVHAREQLGVHREAVFLESTAMGDAVVVHWLADDPRAALARLAASTDPFDVWLRERVGRVHPLPLSSIAEIASANTLIAQYPH